MRQVVIMALAAFMLLIGAAPGHAERRVALVIGNGTYEHADQLANPVLDARRMRDTLAGLGFEVIYAENATKSRIDISIGNFANAVQDADVALVYFAGHGATFGGVPYVVPTDARFSSLAAVTYQLEPVERLIGELRRAKGVRIAILDACRDNTAEQKLKQTAIRGGDTIRGLARVDAPDGLIIAYATQNLRTAKDGPPNQDSPFTAALLHHMATPGLELQQMFKLVAREVEAKTNHEQRPEISYSFSDDYYFVKGDAAPVVPASLPATPTGQPMGAPSPARPANLPAMSTSLPAQSVGLPAMPPGLLARPASLPTTSMGMLARPVSLPATSASLAVDPPFNNSLGYTISPHHVKVDEHLKRMTHLPANTSQTRSVRLVPPPARTAHVRMPPKAKLKPGRETHTLGPSGSISSDSHSTDLSNDD